MSPEEVAEANHSTLESPLSNRHFYDIPAGQEIHYKTLEARNRRFLGFPAVTSYMFHDGKLFSYHVFISGSDADALNDRMRRYLSDAFGENYSTVEDETPLKLIWHFGDRVINFWSFEEDLALADRYRAGFGVVYKPLEGR